MMKTDKKSISKFLALILRHKPEVVGAKLDENGWTDTTILVKKINDHYRNKVVTLEILKETVSEDNKQRYELNDDNSKIRARQGHSISVDLELKPIRPFYALYHGTVERFLSSIFEEGLIKGSRQYVHLSDNLDTARTVGARRGKPVVLVIDSERMHEDGVKFYVSSNGVWLTDYVNPKYIGVAQ